jgi:hypothetical protein
MEPSFYMCVISSFIISISTCVLLLVFKDLLMCTYASGIKEFITRNEEDSVMVEAIDPSKKAPTSMVKI